MMKKFIVAALCALILFAASSVVLNGENTPAVSSGFGFVIW